MESYSICNARRRVVVLKVVSQLSVTSNKSGPLIQRNRCNRTEYRCGPNCVRLTAEGEKVQLNLMRLVVLLLQSAIRSTEIHRNRKWPSPLQWYLLSLLLLSLKFVLIVYSDTSHVV